MTFKDKQERPESVQVGEPGRSALLRAQKLYLVLMCNASAVKPLNYSIRRKSLNADGKQLFCDNSVWIGWMCAHVSYTRVLYERGRLDSEAGAGARSWSWSDRWSRFLGGAWLQWWWLALEASRGPHWAPGPDACNEPWVPSCVGSTARTDT